MSRFRAAVSSPMTALRSTPADEIATTAGRGALNAEIPPDICSWKGPGLYEGFGILLNSNLSCNTSAMQQTSAVISHDNRRAAPAHKRAFLSAKMASQALVEARETQLVR